MPRGSRIPSIRVAEDVVSTIIGKTLQSGGNPFWYWTYLGTEIVNLADRGTILPPGKYLLRWDFRGPVGAPFEFQISESGKTIVTVKSQIQPPPADGWGGEFFNVT